MSVMPRTSPATLEFREDYVGFPFLVYEEAYTCLSIVGIRVVEGLQPVPGGHFGEL